MNYRTVNFETEKFSVECIYANFSCERVGRKETIELWELVLFKANNKGAYIWPLPHVYAFVCKGMFFLRFDLPSDMYPVKTSVTDTDALLPSEKIE